jgi:hypothetical protein
MVLGGLFPTFRTSRNGVQSRGKGLKRDGYKSLCKILTQGIAESAESAESVRNSSLVLAGTLTADAWLSGEVFAVRCD